MRLLRDLYVFVGKGNAGVADECQLDGSVVIVINAIALPWNDSLHEHEPRQRLARHHVEIMLRFGEMHVNTPGYMTRLLASSVSAMEAEEDSLLQIVRVIIKVVVIFIHIEFVVVKISSSESISVQQLVIIVITIKYTSNARIQLPKLVLIQLASGMVTSLLYLLISILILIWRDSILKVTVYS